MFIIVPVIDTRRNVAVIVASTRHQSHREEPSPRRAVGRTARATAVAQAAHPPAPPRRFARAAARARQQQQASAWLTVVVVNFAVSSCFAPPECNVGRIRAPRPTGPPLPALKVLHQFRLELRGSRQTLEFSNVNDGLRLHGNLPLIAVPHVATQRLRGHGMVVGRWVAEEERKRCAFVVAPHNVLG